MSGGHWTLPPVHSRKYSLGPQLRRVDTKTKITYLEKTGTDSRTTHNPSIISKPLTPKIAGEKHV